MFREVDLGSEMTYHPEKGQVDKLGGEASLTEAAKLEGNLHTATSKEDYLLQQKFEIPMCADISRCRPQRTEEADDQRETG